QIKQISDLLIDIHSQHETLFLRQSDFQLSVLDAFAETGDDLSKFQILYGEFQKLEKKLSSLQEEEKKSKADEDYYQFLFNELDEVSLKEGEQEVLEQDLNTVTHAEEIKSNLNGVSGELNSGE